jgi:hypothetical protein
MSEAQTGMGGMVTHLGRTTCARLQAMWPPVSGFFSNSLFSIKTSTRIFLEFISNNTYMK